MFKKVKIFLNVILVIALFTGFFGFFLSFGFSSSVVASLSDKQYSVAEMNSLKVDEKGNFYIGIPTLSRIQVYDLNGSFLYSIVIPTGGRGHFEFDIIKDELHIFVTRTNNHIVFRGKDILCNEILNKNSFYELKNNYNAKNDKIYVAETGEKYIWKGLNRIDIISHNNLTGTIKLTSPLFTPDINFFIIITCISFVAILILNREIVENILQYTQVQNRKT